MTCPLHTEVIINDYTLRKPCDGELVEWGEGPDKIIACPKCQAIWSTDSKD